MSWKHAFLVAMTTVTLAWYFHAPLPDAITEQWKLKLAIAGFRVANLMASMGEQLGLDSSLNISRWAFASAFRITSYPVSDQGLVIRDTVISGVPTRIYRPDGVTEGELLPAVIYYHGGGTVSFSVDTYDNVLRQIAKDVRVVVMAPEYRLSPEYRYPVPLDDCVKVTNHVMHHASDYLVDINRVALAGDSAGGLLTPAVALRLAMDSRAIQQPKLQVLLYPMLQAFDFQLPSYVALDGAMHEIIPAGAIAGAWYMYCTGRPPVKLVGILANNHTSKALKQSKYAEYVSIDLMDDKFKLKKHRSSRSLQFDPELAEEFEGCLTDPFFSPLMTPDFSLFPTSYVMTTEFDVLRDEGIMFVSRLKEAGVRFFHNHISNGWHGVVSYTRTESGQKALESVIEFLLEHL